MTETCCHLACEQPATASLRSKYARYPWLACPEHQPEMLRALLIGQPADSGEVLVLDLVPARRLRPTGAA